MRALSTLLAFHQRNWNRGYTYSNRNNRRARKESSVTKIYIDDGQIVANWRQERMCEGLSSLSVPGQTTKGERRTSRGHCMLMRFSRNRERERERSVLSSRELAYIHRVHPCRSAAINRQRVGYSIHGSKSTGIFSGSLLLFVISSEADIFPMSSRTSSRCSGGECFLRRILFILLIVPMILAQ